MKNSSNLKYPALFLVNFVWKLSQNFNQSLPNWTLATIFSSYPLHLQVLTKRRYPKPSPTTKRSTHFHLYADCWTTPGAKIPFIMRKIWKNISKTALADLFFQIYLLISNPLYSYSIPRSHCSKSQYLNLYSLSKVWPDLISYIYSLRTTRPSTPYQ